MKVKDQKEMLDLINQSIQRIKQVIESIKESDNPASKEMLYRAEGELNAFRSVKDFMRGDKFMLKVDARGSLVPFS